MKVLSTSAIAFAMLLSGQPAAAQGTPVATVEGAIDDLFSQMVPASARMCEVTSEAAYMECLGFNDKSVVTPVKAQPDGGMPSIVDDVLVENVPDYNVPEPTFLPPGTESMITTPDPGFAGVPVQCIPPTATAFVQFDFASAAIKPADMQNLWRLADIATRIDLAGCDIRLAGHADAYGSDGANMVLSDKRARAAHDVMAMAGIDPARIWAKGYGETRLHPDYRSDPTHRIHRRVELVFVPRN